ncbi:MAG: sensor histidine kinase [Eubacterium sp.]|nr:sensor histidine kinase [Eubacterium sp.]
MLDQPLINCENETVNVILALYSETTYNNNISFSIKANIPKETFVDKKDLSVLFGNILENASDACKDVEGERFINLNASYNTPADGHKSLTLIVKNNYATEPSVSSKGIFRSTKHSGDGIGISSVRNITEKYNGASTFTHQDGIFTVSVILYDNSL